jgi:hypothetical protein
MIDDQKFFAWLDGELSGDDAAAVEREVAADSRLTALAEQHRSMQARLKGALGQVADAPVPERLSALLRPQKAEVVDLEAARRARSRRNWGSLPQWGAIAATLAIGILIGSVVPPRSRGPLQLQDGTMYAAAGLQHALDTQLASAPANNAVRVGITFRNQAGAICRSFTNVQASGLACRDSRGWQVRGLFAAPEGQSTSYRMAAGMDPNLAALVDSTMAGEPFDAAQERAARERGWR